MIKHTVAFTLKHAADSAEEKDFLEAGLRLAGIPGVQHFECLRQVGKKNAFTFGFSMEFASEAEYRAYNDHADHVDFVNNRWIPEVTDYLEIDYAPCDIIR